MKEIHNVAKYTFAVVGIVAFLCGDFDIAQWFVLIAIFIAIEAKNV